MRADDVMLIGDMAARTGLSVSAIRFYEAKGLIAPVRSPGGQRRSGARISGAFPSSGSRSSWV